METKTKIVLPVLLLAVVATLGIGQVGKTWACGLDDLQSCFGGVGTSPYFQGEQDGIYDHEHGLVYNPVGQCSTCNGEDFENGYSAGWSQSQESSQGAEVNVVNSPGAQVSVNQGSNQGQSQGPQPVGGCNGPCGGGPSACDFGCGGPPVGPCDFGCGGLGFHHFWHFGSCGFGCSGPYRHIDFGSGDP